LAVEGKYDRLARLMTMGKEKGYVLYDEVSDVLPADLNAGADLDDLLAGLVQAVHDGVEVGDRGAVSDGDAERGLAIFAGFSGGVMAPDVLMSASSFAE